MTNTTEVFSSDLSPSSAHKGSSRTTRWNDPAYSAQTSSTDTTSGNVTMLASLSYLSTSGIPRPTGTVLLNVSSTHLSNTDNNGISMTAGSSIVTVTSVLTFTAVRISVYTVPYSLSDSTYPSDSMSSSTARTVTSSSHLDSASSSYQAASSTLLLSDTSTTLPPDTTTNTKLVVWAATSGVALILIFAFLSWWLRRHRKRTINSSEKPTTIFSLSWLPWKQKRKEIPRTSFSTYPFKAMAQPTPNNSENFMNET